MAGLSSANALLGLQRGREGLAADGVVVVATDTLGMSGRATLQRLIAGDRDPAELADLAKRRLRSKIPELTEALVGRFTEHHAFLARVHLDLIDRHTAAIEEMTARIEVVIEPFQELPRPDLHHPGVAPLVADAIIAETART